MRLTYAITGTAKVTWDDSARRVSQLTGEADVTLSTTIAGIPGPGGSGVPDVACDFEGEATWEVVMKDGGAGSESSEER